MPAYQRYTDQELLDLLKQEDRAAFTEIYDRYASKIYYQVNQMLRDKDATKDLVQDLFIIIWNKAANIKAGANLAGYLYIAAQNSVLKYMRKDRRQNDYLNSLMQLEHDLSSEHDVDYDVDLLYDLIQQEIAKLPSKMKAIFELSRQGDLSYKDIAMQLDIAENTVRKQVSNALKIIRGNVDVESSSALLILALLKR